MDVLTDKKHKENINKIMLIHHLFEHQKDKTPVATAIIFGDERLTYSQLDCAPMNLAAAILAASPNSLIAGVSTFRSIETIISVLAMLKAGKAYLPLDPDYPQERLLQIVTDSGIDLCLATTSQKHIFEPFPINVLASDKTYDAISHPLPATNSAAYVLYTSGSTGNA